MKKTETLYSYLYKKSNKMWAVKYKFHKKDAYKNTSLGTRNKREAEFVSNEEGIVKLKLNSGKIFDVVCLFAHYLKNGTRTPIR